MQVCRCTTMLRRTTRAMFISSTGSRWSSCSTLFKYRVKSSVLISPKTPTRTHFLASGMTPSPTNSCQDARKCVSDSPLFIRCLLTMGVLASLCCSMIARHWRCRLRFDDHPFCLPVDVRPKRIVRSYQTAKASLTMVQRHLLKVDLNCGPQKHSKTQLQEKAPL